MIFWCLFMYRNGTKNLKNLGRRFHDWKLVWSFGLVYSVKCVKNSGKKTWFSKIGLKPTQKPKHMNQMSTQPFWGVFREVFWSLFLDWGAWSAIFWHVKTGTFGKNTRFHVPKNGSSGAETKKPRPLFNANIPPKWCRTSLFYAFIIFGWV